MIGVRGTGEEEEDAGDAPEPGPFFAVVVAVVEEAPVVDIRRFSVPAMPYTIRTRSE